MEKYLTGFKVIVTGVVSVVVSCLGGYDKILSLLVVLILADFLTGIVYAIMQKNLSSTELRNGIMRKLLVFLAIFIAYRVDLCIIEANGSPITLWGMTLSIRTLFIVYSCLEEGISLLENLANIGVPFPCWLKDVLVQVSDCVNKSTPKEVLSWIKRVFNIDIKTSNKDSDTDGKNKDEKDEKDDKIK